MFTMVSWYKTVTPTFLSFLAGSLGSVYFLLGLARTKRMPKGSLEKSRADFSRAIGMSAEGVERKPREEWGRA